MHGFLEKEENLGTGVKLNLHRSPFDGLLTFRSKTKNTRDETIKNGKKKKKEIRTPDTKSRPQRVNSLLRALWWSGVSRIPIRWICTGWIPSDSELCMWFQKPWVTESLYIKHRSARGVYRATAPALVVLLTSGAFERVARQWARSVIVRASASER